MTRRPAPHRVPTPGNSVRVDRGPDTRAIKHPRQLRDEPPEQANDETDEVDISRAGSGRRPFGGNLLAGTGIQQRQHIGLSTRVFEDRDGNGLARADSLAVDPGAFVEQLPPNERSGVIVGRPRRPSGRMPSQPAVEVQPSLDANATVEGHRRILTPPRVQQVVQRPAPQVVREHVQPQPARRSPSQPAAPVPQPPPRRPPSQQVAPAQPAPRPAPPPAPAPAPAPAPYRAAPEEDLGERGEVVVFFGCRGGVGSTLLATSLGAALASAGVSCCLIDLDLQLGEALSYLGVESRMPISNLVRDMDTVDWEMLSARLPRHTSGLCTLSQAGFVDELREIEPSRIPTLLNHLRKQFRVILIDGVRDFNDHALAALDAADRVVLVTTQDVPAVRGVARRLHIMRRLGFQQQRFTLLVNRFRTSDAMTPALIGEEIGLEPSLTIGNDFATASRAVNSGLALRECRGGSGGLADQVEEMARRFFAVEEQPTKRGLFSRIFGRKDR
jgi:MinD-like ATPase involved in chromosome partitioning or flagellar assembly